MLISLSLRSRAKHITRYVILSRGYAYVLTLKFSYFQLQSLTRLTFFKGLSISMSAEKKMNDRKVIGTHDVREHISNLMTNTFVLSWQWPFLNRVNSTVMRC